MSFPLYILLAPYALFLLFWLFFSGVSVYHMMKFGVKGITTIFITVLYVAIAGSMLIISLFYISTVNWDTNVTVFGGLHDINTPSYEL